MTFPAVISCHIKIRYAPKIREQCGLDGLCLKYKFKMVIRLYGIPLNAQCLTVVKTKIVDLISADNNE